MPAIGRLWPSVDDDDDDDDDIRIKVKPASSECLFLLVSCVATITSFKQIKQMMVTKV